MSSETPEFISSVRINENGEDHICRHCERIFRSNRGLNQHYRSCKENIGSEYEPVKERHECIEHQQIQQRVQQRRVLHKNPTRGATIPPTYLR